MAHGGKKHKKDSAAAQNDSTGKQHDQHVEGDTARHHHEDTEPDDRQVTADLGDFPSLHPLIVHFAIVLIVVAAALQLVNVFLLRKELAWIVAAILLVGFLAAWFASKDLHPHTQGLSKHAELVLEQHDKFADRTISSAMVGLVLQIVYLVMMKYTRHIYKAPVKGADGLALTLRRVGSLVVALVLLSSAYFVSRAGHYGAQLVHIEGIGPQGRHLETEHDH